MRGKDWPNLWRMCVALWLLLLTPLLGIAVGAVCWGSLERGLLVFNLLGLAGFALATRPFWQGNKKRIRGLVRSALALGISALLDVLSGRPVPFAVYFSSMVECFSLIPWIIEILQEIHRGQWRERPRPSPFSAPLSTVRRETPPIRQKPVYEGPEEPVPGFPRWGYLLLVLFLGLALLLLLTSCHSPAEITPSPSPSPIPTPVVLPAETPAETAPEAEEEFPFLAAENERWMVYVDHYERPGRDAFLDFSVYDKEGNLFQSLSMTSPYLHDYDGSLFREGGLISFRDLNFDGLPDLLVLYENIRTGAYDAFLWNEETGQFTEELSFTQITGPCYINKEENLVFGSGSSSSSSGGWSVHRYVPGEGYRLEYYLEVFSLDDEDHPGLSIETRYENGEAVSSVESWDGMGLSDIWDKRTEEFWGE